MRFDPRDVLHRRVLFQDHRLELVLLFDQVKPLDDILAFEVEAPRIVFDAIVDVDLFDRFVREDYVVGRA